MVQGSLVGYPVVDITCDMGSLQWACAFLCVRCRPLRGFVTKVALVNIFNGTLPELTEQPSDGDYEESDFFGSVWLRVLDTINRKLTKDHKVVLASGQDRDAPWVDSMGYGHGPFYGHYSPYMGPVNELYDLP